MPIISSPQTTCRILDCDAASAPKFVERWRALSERAWVSNPFWDPDFCLPLIKELHQNDVKIAALQTADQNLIALAPLQFKRWAYIGPPVAELWTHDYIPLGTPLVDPNHPLALSQLLEGILDASNGPIFGKDIKQLSTLLPHSDVTFNTEILDQHKRAVVKSTLNAESYRRQTLSQQRRQGLDRRYRKLEKMTQIHGPLVIDICSDPTHLPSQFEAFMTLEKKGWKGSQNTALLSHDAHARFARQATKSLSQRGHCIIATLKAGDFILAALTLFEMNDEVFTWKTTFDEDYGAFSPGVQILSRFSQAFMQEGKPFSLDSCASPNNDIANMLWGEREAIDTVIIAKPEHTLAASVVKQSFKGMKKARGVAKKLLGR